MAEKILIPDVDLAATNEMFFSELEDTTSTLLNRHLNTSRKFYPSDFVYSLSEEDASDPNNELPIAAKVSLLVNLVTEEGLPYYTSALENPIPKDHPFQYWLWKWTAEEGRHGPTIANYMTSTGQINMHLVEDARMAMMSKPDTPRPSSAIEGIVYPALQERATRISHSNTMLLLPRGHKIGKKAFGYVVGDEGRHEDFYTNLTTAALEINPSYTIIALAKQVKGFAMPGKSIPGFADYADIIDDAHIFGGQEMLGIYDTLITGVWDIWNKTGLTSDAEKARDYIRKYMDRMPELIAIKARRRDISKTLARITERGWDPSMSASPAPAA